MFLDYFDNFKSLLNEYLSKIKKDYLLCKENHIKLERKLEKSSQKIEDTNALLKEDKIPSEKIYRYVFTFISNEWI